MKPFYVDINKALQFQRSLILTILDCVIGMPLNFENPCSSTDEFLLSVNIYFRFSGSMFFI